MIAAKYYWKHLGIWAYFNRCGKATTKKKLKAVDKETDQRKLTEIAVNASARDVSMAAINKLSSQPLLADIAKTHGIATAVAARKYI